ncbi:hybrid sensor histidine kinase/response regulator transcription factor [Sinomicrobium sp. M5D2P9]
MIKNIVSRYFKSLITFTGPFLCVAISCLLFIPMAWGQSGKLYSTDAELSSSLVNQVYSDSRGFIWVATEDGVNRYDGAKFRKIKHDERDTSSILNNYIRVIFEDNKNRLLFGFFNGLQMYDYDTQSFTEIPIYNRDKTRLHPHITSITQRKNGDILIGTSGFGIFILKKENRQYSGIRMDPLISSDFITKLFEDDSENLWILTHDQGLFRVSPDKKTNNFFTANTGDGNISSICQVQNGDIYAANLNQGLFKYDKEQKSFRPVAGKNRKQLSVKTLYVSGENEILIGTDGEGIKLFNTQNRQISDLNPGVDKFDFSRAKVHSITEDRSGNLWLGIYQKGVMLIPSTSNNFKYIGYQSAQNNAIGSNCVMSVLKDHQGVLWVGTDGDGLYGVAPDGRQIAHFAPPHAPATIMSVFEDSEHNLWVGSYLKGLAKVNRKTGKFDYVDRIVDDQSHKVESIYAITEDRDKNLWIGSMGAGLFSINLKTNKVTRHCRASNGKAGDRLNNKWINCLLYTDDNQLYIGTYDGLGFLDLNTMSFINKENTNHILGNNIVYTLYKDKDKNIWIGTSEGLYRKSSNPGNLKKFTNADGLSSDFICAVRGDEKGNLWISTHYGISRLDIKKQHFTNYYINDGLQGNEFSKGAAYSGHSGEIIFGGTNGVTFFAPELIKDGGKTPDVKITAFYVQNKEVKKGTKSGNYAIIDKNISESDTVQLAHQDNTFSIEFATADFTAPEKITYYYSLNRNDWVSLRQTGNNVTFNDLSPGTYTFRVKARENKTFSVPQEITIIIHPPWYASVLAKICYVVLAILIGILIYHQIHQRYRTRQKIRKQQYHNQINEAKLQFFINISHEIKTPISLIINPLNKLIRSDGDPDRQRSYKLMQRNSERILHLINQLIDVRKIDKGQIALKFQKTEIIGFIHKVCTIFEDQIQTKNIRFEFRHSLPSLYMFADPAYFDKVIQNVLSNAFKFTPDNGTILLALETVRHSNGEDYARITVKDNGIGIKPEETERIFNRFYQNPNADKPAEGTGIGLHFTRSIVNLHHGTIRAESDPTSEGATFVIEIPLEAHHFGMESSSQPNTLLPEYEPKREPYITNFYPDTEDRHVRSRTKYNVLIVDDDEDIRNYLHKELAPLYHVAECCNGKQAIVRILQKNPDLIISDVKMPEIDGITLCKRIKQNVNINHIPVILLTAKTTVNDNIEGLATGADAYLSKPFNMEILKKTVRNLIQNRELLKNIYSGNQVKEDNLYKIDIKSADEKLLQKVTCLINDNISNPDLHVEMMATEIGISRVHLFRKLKELTNQSPRDFIRNIRLKQAGELLTSKNLSVTEVAYATGFSNVSKFSSGFKEFYGVTPTVYREKEPETVVK